MTGLVLAGALISAGAASATLVPFTSPSGNIDCMMSRMDGALSVECMVEKANWKRAPRRPADCPLEWIPTQVNLNRGTLSVGSCRGDIGPQCMPASTGAKPCAVLRYGARTRLGSLVCVSSRGGITCRLRNGAGVGFRVSREGYVLYRR